MAARQKINGKILIFPWSHRNSTVLSYNRKGIAVLKNIKAGPPSFLGPEIHLNTVSS